MVQGHHCAGIYLLRPIYTIFCNTMYYNKNAICTCKYRTSEEDIEDIREKWFSGPLHSGVKRCENVQLPQIYTKPHNRSKWNKNQLIIVNVGSYRSCLSSYFLLVLYAIYCEARKYECNFDANIMFVIESPPLWLQLHSYVKISRIQIVKSNEKLGMHVRVLYG